MADDTEDPLYGNSDSSDSSDTETDNSGQETYEPNASGPPGDTAPRASVYRYPSGEPGSAYYEEQRKKVYEEAQRNAEQFKSVIEPYRDKVMGQLNQSQPQAPELIGPKTDPSRAYALIANTMPFLAVGSKHVRDYIGAALAGVSPKFGLSWGKRRNEQYRDYNQVLKAIKQYNSAQIQQYKSILADKKLDTDQMLKQFKMVSDEYQDVLKADAAKRKDLPGLIKMTEAQERAAANHSKAADNWNLDQQKNWLRNPDNQKYATILNNQGIDLFKLTPNFSDALQKADKKYSYTQFLQDNKASQPKPEDMPAGAPPYQRYAPDRQAQAAKTDPLGLKSKTPATDEEKKAFMDKINSFLPKSDSDVSGQSDSKESGKLQRGRSKSGDDEGPSESDQNLQTQQSQNWGIGNSPAQQSPNPLVSNPLQYGQ